MFGPLFLILLGSALLVNNLYPEVSLTAIFAAHWPWILIAWGGFRLIENIAAAGSGGAPPRPIGAGGVFVALFLIFLGSSLHAARDPGGLFETVVARLDPDIAGWAYDEFRSPVEVFRTANTVEVLVLDDLPGRVRVVASDDEEFAVEGARIIRAVSQESADSEASKEEFSVREQGGRVTIVSQAGGRNPRGRIEYDLTVKAAGGRLPRIESRRTRLDVSGLSEAVQIDANGGRLAIEDMSGPVAIRSDDLRSLSARRLAAEFQLHGSGRGVELSDIAGAVTIDGSFSRTIELAKIEGIFTFTSKSARISAASIPGEAQIRSREIDLKQAAGPVRIHSEGVRNVELDEVEGPIEVRTERGKIDIKTAGSIAAVTVHTGRGEIKLDLPAGAAFSARISTGRGKIRQEFGDALTKKREDRAEQLSGSTGDGPVIELRTDHGDIRLNRHGEIALPAEQPPEADAPAKL
jgi:DUF4097 and DUF4098 domain-containing protein YvlB